MKPIYIHKQMVKADVEKTKALYEELPLISDKAHCGCSDCIYYKDAIIKTSTNIQKFFSQFGIDPRKEAEVWRVCRNDDGTYYYVADYHFIGEIVDAEQLEWVEIEGASFGLTNYRGNLPSTMIPETFTLPIVEMMVKINL